MDVAKYMMPIMLRDSNKVLDDRMITNDMVAEMLPNLQANYIKSLEWAVKYIRENDAYVDRCHTRRENFLKKNRGTIVAKMLLAHVGHEALTVNEVRKICGIPDRYDADCHKSLHDNKLIEFHSKGKHGVYRFAITPFGEEVIKIIKANDPVYRMIRWFKKEDEDVYSKMMQAELSSDDPEADVVNEENMLKCIQAILDENSEMSKIGSNFYYLRQFFICLKNPEFFEKFNNSLVVNWLEQNSNRPQVSRFLKKFKRIQKKFMKLAA